MRPSASWRLRACERSSLTTMRSDTPSLSKRRARWRGPRTLEAAMSKTSSTLVLAVLACCPPGPPLALKRHSSSAAGMTRWRRPTRRPSGARGNLGQEAGAVSVLMNARPPSMAAFPRRRPSSAPTTPPITAPTTGPTNGTGTTAPRRRAPDIAPATVPAVPPACLARCSKSSSTAHLLLVWASLTDPLRTRSQAAPGKTKSSCPPFATTFHSVCNYLCRSQ
jgi:hypothetical protein